MALRMTGAENSGGSKKNLSKERNAIAIPLLETDREIS
jgi:hypothetical protein